MAERSPLQEFTKGLVAQNPVLVLAVGLCPTLAVTTGLRDALAMGAAVIAVLICSNTLISAVRHLIPREIRIPCFIVIIGSFVTMVDIYFKAQLPPEIYASLGIFIPLIVVNCIILHRAESFAYKHGIGRSILDGLGAGVGFTLAICLVAAVREGLGSGTLMGYEWWPKSWPGQYEPASILIQAPGAFVVLGLLLGATNWLQMCKAKKAARTA